MKVQRSLFVSAIAAFGLAGAIYFLTPVEDCPCKFSAEQCALIGKSLEQCKDLTPFWIVLAIGLVLGMLALALNLKRGRSNQ
jgi:hypothetical protein